MLVTEMRLRQTKRKPIRVHDVNDVWPLIKKMGKFTREHFVILLINTRNEVFGFETISIGGIDSTITHPREVFIPAIVHSSAKIILVHNHPSGDPEPSPEDVEVTRRLRAAGELLGIPVIDHIIVGRTHCISLRTREVAAEEKSGKQQKSKPTTPEELLAVIMGLPTKKFNARISMRKTPVTTSTS